MFKYSFIDESLIYTISTTQTESIGNGVLTIEVKEENGTPIICHSYKVIEDSEWAMKIQKTQIKASRGAYGLYHHFYECERDNFAREVWMIEPIKNILNKVKPIA